MQTLRRNYRSLQWLLRLTGDSLLALGMTLVILNICVFLLGL